MFKRFTALGTLSLLSFFSLFAIEISSVDTECSEYEKYTLVVDGNPYWMTSVQVRLDKLYGYEGWNDSALEKVVEQAAADGFNTIGLPLHWREIEPRKDVFDWKILDKYLGWCEKYGLRTELLWFSWSSGGRVQYVSNHGGRNEPRTPDYVCSLCGTSEFNVLKKDWECTLDWQDKALRDREKYVVERLMEHIAARDAEKGNRHTVIGIQLGNEARGYDVNEAGANDIIDYYSAVGEAVKKSDYVVWTRLNCVYGDTPGRIIANADKRAGDGTNIDFVGIDVYGGTAAQIVGDVNGMLPASEGNYRMIMEAGADDTRSPILQIAALAGDKGFSYYNYAVVDGNAMYSADGTALKEKGHVDAVRRRNRMLALANPLVASKSYGQSMHVFNATGSTIGFEYSDSGIGFKPLMGNQGIEITLSDNEIVLLSSGQSIFSIPAGMNVVSATCGHFDAAANWISEGDLAVTGEKISITEPCCLVLEVERESSVGFHEISESECVAAYSPSGLRIDDAGSFSGVAILKNGDGSYTKRMIRN